MNTKQLIKDASNGNYEAQEKLAYCYDKGMNVRKSYVKAFFWYKKASRINNPIVEYNLGLFYLLGQGTKKNDKEAFCWTRKAALQEYPDAMLALAWHFLNGIGTDKNMKLAMKYYKKCLDTECACSAYFSLGEIAYNDSNYNVAFENFNQASKNGHPKSFYYLGKMYFEGKGTAKNKSKAKEYLSKAHKAGIYKATRLLKSKKFSHSQPEQ